MYIELYGDNTQKEDDNMPRNVYLNVSRESASYFKDGLNKVRKFRQSRRSKEFKFNRFSITDEAKCNKAIKAGSSKYTNNISKERTWLTVFIKNAKIWFLDHMSEEE